MAYHSTTSREAGQGLPGQDRIGQALTGLPFGPARQLVLPRPAARSSAAVAALAASAEVQAVVRGFMGFGRTLPAEILDESLVLRIKRAVDFGGVDFAVKFFLFVVPKRTRVQARAVLMNLSKMRRQNGGRLPWEA